MKQPLKHFLQKIHISQTGINAILWWCKGGLYGALIGLVGGAFIAGALSLFSFIFKTETYTVIGGLILVLGDMGLGAAIGGWALGSVCAIAGATMAMIEAHKKIYKPAVAMQSSPSYEQELKFAMSGNDTLSIAILQKKGSLPDTKMMGSTIEYTDSKQALH